MNQIYVLNYLVNKRFAEKKELVVLFDMKAAFDSVDRGIFIESMRKRGMRGGLVVRCEELLRKTVNRVRVGYKEK